MVEDMDSLLEKVIKIKFDNVSCPPSDEVWKGVLSRVRQERRKQKLRRLRTVVAACFLIVIMTVLTLNSELPVKAIANMFIKSVESFSINTLKINKTSKSDSAIISNDPRITDAQEKIHFHISLPEYIPQDYILKKVDVLSVNEKRQKVTLFYEYINGNTKNFIQIMQQSFSNQTDVSMYVNKETETKIKHININGADCTLIVFKDNLLKLMWDNSNISFKIDGTIDENEAVKIAESMK